MHVHILGIAGTFMAGIAVITDCGDENDIHPIRKEPVGARLAVAARGIAHGEKIIFSGPTVNINSKTFPGH